MIPIFKPSYDVDKILTELKIILESGWTGLGPKTQEFEKEVCKYLNAEFALFVNSCTSALHLAAHCLDLPKGSLIAVPDITFASTAAVVLYSNHYPILLPVDDSLSIDLDYLERLFKKKKIDAVIPVHYSGNSCDITRLLELCDYYKCKIIEDCAHAFGSTYCGKNMGTFGSFGCFSFHSVKNLPICDGGIITTKSESQYRRLKRLRWLGIDKSTHDRSKKSYNYLYDIGEVGYKYHGNDILAVIGLAGIKNIEKHNEKRRYIYRRYAKEFPNLVRKNNPNVKSAQHLVSIRINDRDSLIDYMQKNGVSIGVHYKPLSSFPAFEQYASKEIKEISNKQFETIATLPCYPSMTEEELDKVINLLKIKR
jgi:perosamine synthetase